VYAVIGAWDMAPELADKQQAMLRDVIVPSVRQAPGLVKGYWAGEPGQRSHSFVVFETEEAARAFAAAVRANARAQSESGVGADVLIVVRVAAET
jgi:hypothetical protein